MAKRRKTRKEKMLADRRQNLLTSQQHIQSPASEETSAISSPAYTFTKTPQVTHTPSHTTQIITTGHYEYLRKDLLKTSMLTGAIVLAELLLFFGANIGK